MLCNAFDLSHTPFSISQETTESRFTIQVSSISVIRTCRNYSQQRCDCMKQKLTKQQKADLAKYENMADYYEQKDFSREWDDSAKNGSFVVNKVSAPIKRARQG